MSSDLGNAAAAVQSVIDRTVREGTESGIQVAAYVEDTLIVDAYAGWADVEARIGVDGTTLFNVYSVTKAVAATALHLQAERGLIDYAAPLARYWPEFASNGKADITVHHVLTHRSGVFAMPPQVTPERMSDWDWMVREIAAARPAFPAGTRSSYQSLTFGWLVGELVRRTDPEHRPFGRFVQDEIAAPLGITDLWIGIPAEVEPRVAKLYDGVPTPYPDNSLYRVACPKQVDLCAAVFSRPDVRRACIPGVGGIFNARSIARFYAMLANGGRLDGTRLLSADRVRTFSQPRPHPEEPDPVFFGITVPIGVGGYWLGGPNPPVCAVGNPRALCHPGMGGSIAWADPERRLAVGICHNLSFTARSPSQDRMLPIASALRSALGLE